MKINIGSINEVKVSALRELLPDYSDFVTAEVQAVKVPSEVSHQPASLDETIQGAMNRARNAFQECDYSFGIESGLMAVPHTKTGYMDFTACAIYDGQEFHLGFSPVIECPEEVMRLVLDKGMNFNQAFYSVGLTDNPEIGSSEGGMVGLLTKGRLTRKEYTKLAITTAMVHLDNKI